MNKLKTKRIITAALAGLMIVSITPTTVLARPETLIQSKNVGPGPVKPLNTNLLENFNNDAGWIITGADAQYSTSGGTFTLNSNIATVSKTFSYATWDYSDLYVNINDISQGSTWSLSVKGTDSESIEKIIQKDSPNKNSRFGESFLYSLEGLAGSEAQSNWNNESINRKEFTMTFTLKGKVGDIITLGDIKNAQPNYTIPQALPSNVKGKYAGINFDGDQTLDVDTLKNDDTNSSSSSTLNEHMWLSLPYSRLVLFPGFEFDNGKITPVDPNLDLRFGAYYGIGGNANKTTIDGTKISESKSGYQGSSLNSLLTIDNTSISKDSITSAWYPHKLERSADVVGKGHIDLIDYMIDLNTIGRIIDVSEMAGNNLNVTVKDSSKDRRDGMNANNLKSSWDVTNGVVVKSDELYTDWNTNLFYTAMKVVALNEDGSFNEEKTNLISTPTFIDGVGKYDIPASIGKIGLVIGYSTREEGKEVAIKRAVNSATGNMVATYNKNKEYWNNMLRKAPVPDKFGIEDTNIKDSSIVTEENHKVLYYAGWVHNLINILGATPETGYAYSQQALGKPSRQTGGANMTPANNSWEGVMQIQNIMYLDPSAAWSGMEGFMSMVDANGFLDGEVLPVRMAQTFWMVNSISPDKARLESIYPALSRHLKYKISDPRWIYGSTASQNEIDQEYITSWLNDVVYMKKICEYLGGDYSNEIAYWNSEYNKALANYADWFFSDPTSHESIGSYPQDGSGPKTLRNGAELPSANYQRGLWTRIFHKDGDVNYFKDTCSTNIDGTTYVHSNKGGHTMAPGAPGRYPREWVQVILSGLVVSDIPTAQAKQLEQFFLDINNPALSLAGMENCKWAPSSFLVYGLINRGFYDEAKNQLDSYLVKSIDVWEFCENYFYNQTGPKGTSPTSFGASQIIDITMLKNGVMNDGSGVTAIPNWEDGMNKAVSPETIVYLEEDLDINNLDMLPKEITQVYNRKNFNDEKYTLNKVTSVKWDIDTLTAIDYNTYTITGITETYDNVTATIKTNFHKN